MPLSRVSISSISEKKLADSGQLEKYYRPYFPGKPNFPLYIEDDHLPFLRKGKTIIDIVHL